MVDGAVGKPAALAPTNRPFAYGAASKVSSSFVEVLKQKFPLPSSFAAEA